jgi:hypothetical protein
MFCLKVCILCFLIPIISWAEITTQEYSASIVIHREAVLALAMAAQRQFPNDFSGVSKELVLDFLELHDRVKTVGLPELQSRGYTHAFTLIQRLVDFHGFSIKDLSPQEKVRLKEVIDSLNEIELAEKRIFFSEQHLSVREIEQLQWLEHIVDVTDVGVSRRAEMGIGKGLHDGEKYLIGQGDLRGAEISHWLENNYAISLIEWRAPSCLTILEDKSLPLSSLMSSHPKK